MRKEVIIGALTLVIVGIAFWYWFKQQPCAYGDLSPQKPTVTIMNNTNRDATKVRIKVRMRDDQGNTAKGSAIITTIEKGESQSINVIENASKWDKDSEEKDKKEKVRKPVTLPGKIVSVAVIKIRAYFKMSDEEEKAEKKDEKKITARLKFPFGGSTMSTYYLINAPKGEKHFYSVSLRAPEEKKNDQQ